MVVEHKMRPEQAREYERDITSRQESLSAAFIGLVEMTKDKTVEGYENLADVISAISQLLSTDWRTGGEYPVDEWTDKYLTQVVQEIMTIGDDKQKASQLESLQTRLIADLARSEDPFKEYIERELVTAFQTQLHDSFVGALQKMNKGKVVLPKNALLRLVHEKLNEMPDGVITSRQPDGLITQLFGTITSDVVTVFVDVKTKQNRMHRIGLFQPNAEEGIDPVYEIHAEYGDKKHERVNVDSASRLQRIHSDVERMAFMVALAQAVGEAAGMTITA